MQSNIIFRYSSRPLDLDLGVQIVLFVFGLPVAEGHPQSVNQRAVDVAAVLGGAGDLVFGNED
jgi:hypothetical protein